MRRIGLVVLWCARASLLVVAAVAALLLCVGRWCPGAVGVEGRQHEVPGGGRLHRDPRRLGIADLPHEDHVGILPQERAQGRGKAQTRRGIDGHLHDTVARRSPVRA